MMSTKIHRWLPSAPASAPHVPVASLALYALVLCGFGRCWHGWPARRELASTPRQAHCENANEQRIPVRCEHTDPAPGSAIPNTPSDVTTMNVVPRIAGANSRGTSASAAAGRQYVAFVVQVTPDQVRREAGSRADNHRNAKSEGKQGYPDEMRSTGRKRRAWPLGKRRPTTTARRGSQIGRRSTRGSVTPRLSFSP